ncbi:hypothetical protein [Altericroceibacterium endophyticum]|uniref:Uncharacterized protein n=1 Tax=Altericroceibacterium endophyticum TaxID=1808508 RepID=A0A6I4SZS8_9SPHN|nr:hypothetical protein [Altericroceibacterium endophyticum]MXO64207.1 hypothetical protein [Altericroceibacterium endophyticum]
MSRRMLGKGVAGIALVLALAGCNRHEAPADDVVAKAEEIANLSSPEVEPLAPGPYAPRDTCQDVKGASDFRENLATAVEARDADGLIALAADDIKLDSAGASGADELRKRLNDPSWKLWDELDALLTLGCSANKQGGITLPWYYTEKSYWIDPARAMVVTDENVALQEKPSAKSDTIQRVSWQLVEVKGVKPDAEYQEVTLKDGEHGFLPTDKLRSVLDYHLVASSRNQKWSITSLLAGD